MKIKWSAVLIWLCLILFTVSMFLEQYLLAIVGLVNAANFYIMNLE